MKLSTKTPVVSLYNEDGISITVMSTDYSEYGYCLCADNNPDCELRIVGHKAYAASIEMAHRLIFDAWIDAGKPGLTRKSHGMKYQTYYPASSVTPEQADLLAQRAAQQENQPCVIGDITHHPAPTGEERRTAIATLNTQLRSTGIATREDA